MFFLLLSVSLLFFFELIWSYLTDRTQSVINEGTKSLFSTLRDGVPQGSLLGPLLFIVCVQPLAHAVSSV